MSVLECKDYICASSINTYLIQFNSLCLSKQNCTKAHHGRNHKTMNESLFVDGTGVIYGVMGR